jgi:hypothetical protein
MRLINPWVGEPFSTSYVVDATFGERMGGRSVGLLSLLDRRGGRVAVA